MFISRLFLIIFFLLTLQGCLATLQKKYPAMYESAQTEFEIPIYIDVIIHSDIKGRDIGFDPVKNQEARKKAKDAILQLLKDKGFQPSTVYLGSGALFELPKTKKPINHWLLHDEHPKEKRPFEGPVVDEGDEAWSKDGTSSFIKLISDWEQYNAIKSNKHKHKAPATKVSETVIPNIIANLNSEYLAILQLETTRVATAKTVGSMVLTGAISAALTGGMYVHMSGPVNGAKTRFTVINPKTAKTIWHNSEANTGTSKSSLEHLLRYFPKTPNAKPEPKRDKPAYGPGS